LRNNPIYAIIKLLLTWKLKLRAYEWQLGGGVKKRSPAMKTIKTMTIFGTRPEVIKLAPVIQKLDESANFSSVLVTTGQHREMLGQALDQFGIIPDYNLDIMAPNQAVSDVTINSLRGIEEIISIEKPDLVLVQGDTTTAFAGCLAAFYQKTAVGHVEAGLRTYDKFRPFPEEINRSMITQLADLHFVPTLSAWDALRREGVTEEKLFITGNTVIDALFSVVSQDHRFSTQELENAGKDGKRLIVVTSHRRENFGEPLRNICNGILELLDKFADIEIIFSVHRNPKVNVPVHAMLGDHDRIHLVEPLNYLDMANLISRAYMVMTDSGGLQEEAPALAKPVLVLRDMTERPEAVQAGLAKIIGTSRKAIFAAGSELLTDKAVYASMTQGLSPYGDGEAATRIIGAIEYVNGLLSFPPDPFVSGMVEMVTGDQTFVGPISDELFYSQLDERIKRARKERQRVSVATFNLEETDSEQFANAVKTITRGLRKSDTAAALDGKRLVLVLPGANEAQARRTADRLMERLAGPLNRRREADRIARDLPQTGNESEMRLNVDIKTYEEADHTAEDDKTANALHNTYSNVDDR